jgi:hypothetical protein
VIGRDSTFALGWVTKATALINLGRATEAISILERRVAELPASRPSETHACWRIRMLGQDADRDHRGDARSPG